MLLLLFHTNKKKLISLNIDGITTTTTSVIKVTTCLSNDWCQILQIDSLLLFNNQERERCTYQIMSKKVDNFFFFWYEKKWNDNLIEWLIDRSFWSNRKKTLKSFCNDENLDWKKVKVFSMWESLDLSKNYRKQQTKI